MKELIEELKNLGDKVDTKYVIEKLQHINPYFEVARCEVESAVDDLWGDDLWSCIGHNTETLENLTDKEINELAWHVEDEDIWNDIYEVARGYVIGLLEEE